MYEKFIIDIQKLKTTTINYQTTAYGKDYLLNLT